MVAFEEDGLGSPRPFGVEVFDGEVFLADASGLIQVNRTNGVRALCSSAAGSPLFAVRKRDADTFLYRISAVSMASRLSSQTGLAHRFQKLTTRKGRR